MNFHLLTQRQSCFSYYFEANSKYNIILIVIISVYLFLKHKCSIIIISKTVVRNSLIVSEVFKLESRYLQSPKIVCRILCVLCIFTGAELKAFIRHLRCLVTPQKT